MRYGNDEGFLQKTSIDGFCMTETWPCRARAAVPHETKCWPDRTRRVPAAHITTVQRVLDGAARYGVAAEDLRRAARIRNGSPEWVPAEALFVLWQHAVKWSARPDLPIEVARRFQLDHAGVLGFSMLTAPSMRAALDAAAIAYPKTVTDTGSWSHEDHHEETVVRFQRSGPTSSIGLLASNEAAIAQAFECIRQAAARPIALKRARLRHRPAPPALDALRGYFAAPVETGAADDALVFDRRSLDESARLAHGPMHAFLRQVADRTTSTQVPRVDWTTRASRAIRAGLLADVSQSSVARSLGVTPRTLARRLAAEGTSFRALFDAARREEAVRLLSHPGVSVTSVALELGFSDSSTFSRAFRRWYGSPPSLRGWRRE